LLVELGLVFGAVIEYVCFEQGFVEFPFGAKGTVEILRWSASLENMV